MPLEPLLRGGVILAPDRLGGLLHRLLRPLDRRGQFRRLPRGLERGAGAVLRGCEVAGQRAGAGGEVGVPFALRAGAETVGGGARIAGLAADATDLVAELAQGGEVLVLEREVGQFADADLARLGLGDLVGGRVR